jgi:hypothetical protein
MSAEIIQFGGTKSARPIVVNPKVRPDGESDQNFVARIAAAPHKPGGTLTTTAQNAGPVISAARGMAKS